MDEGPSNNKSKSSGEGEAVKYWGLQKRPSGKYAAHIRDSSRNGEKVWLGTFKTADEAARVYGKAANDMRGHSAILNFPQENNLQSASSELTPTPSGPQHEKEVFVFEYFDNQLLEDLLDDKRYEKKD